MNVVAIINVDFANYREIRLLSGHKKTVSILERLHVTWRRRLKMHLVIKLTSDSFHISFSYSFKSKSSSRFPRPILDVSLASIFFFRLIFQSAIKIS